MSTIAQKIAFATEHWRDSKGRPFDLSPPERRWVIDEYWLALDGYKYWPAIDVDVNDESANAPLLCEEASSLVGKLIEWDWSKVHHIERTAEGDRFFVHPAHDRCPGLLLEPQNFVWENLPRREGKTLNFMAFVSASMFIDFAFSCTYVAGSEDQTDELFEENFRKPVDDNKRLKDACYFIGNKCIVPRTKSFIELVPTTHRSITGRGRALVGFDESRDIPARAMMALQPSTWAENGIKCPRGHVHGPRSAQTANVKCPVAGCGERLVPWSGRVAFLSSSGIEGENQEYDWFGEGIDLLREHPDKNHYAYKRDESWNPNVSEGAKGATERVFGKLESTRDYVAIEVHNERRRKGEIFLRKDQLAAAWDKALRSLDAYAKPAIGFLDTSQTKELTSLVCVGDDRREDESRWFRTFMNHLTIWEPKGTLIDEHTVLPFFDALMPRWPQLMVHVDTRVRPWAERFVKFVKTNRNYGRRVDRFQGQREERDSGYSTLEEMVLATRTRLMPHPILKKEFDAARKKPDPSVPGRTEVREHKRWVRHLDVLDGLAACHYFVYLEQLKAGVGLHDIEQRARDHMPANRRDDRERERDLVEDAARGGRGVFAMLDQLYKSSSGEPSTSIANEEF